LSKRCGTAKSCKRTDEELAVGDSVTGEAGDRVVGVGAVGIVELVAVAVVKGGVVVTVEVTVAEGVAGE